MAVQIKISRNFFKDTKLWPVDDSLQILVNSNGILESLPQIQKLKFLKTHVYLSASPPKTEFLSDSDNLGIK